MKITEIKDILEAYHVPVLAADSQLLQYRRWARKMLSCLADAEVLEVVKPTVAPTREAVETISPTDDYGKKRVARLFLLAAIDEVLHEDLESAWEPAEMWNELQHRFGAQESEMVAFRRACSEISFRVGDSAAGFLRALERLRLDTDQPEEVLVQELVGKLPPVMAKLQVELEELLMSPESHLNWKTVSTMLLREEKILSRQGVWKTDEGLGLLKVAAVPRVHFKENCKICGEPDHSETSCPSVTCGKCGTSGHWETKCINKATGEQKHQGSYKPIQIDVVKKQVQKVNKVDGSAYVKCPVTKSLLKVQRDGVTGTSPTVLDSGASVMVFGDRKWLSNIRSCSPVVLRLADDRMLCCNRQAEANVPVIVEGVKKILNLKKVYYAPSLGVNLVSVSAITRLSRNVAVVFIETRCKILDLTGQSTIASGTRRDDGLYHLDIGQDEQPMREEKGPRLFLAKKNNGKLWHDRLGHVDATRIRKTLQIAEVEAAEDIPDCKDCETCVERKFKSLPFGKTGAFRSEGPLDLVHLDLSGEMPSASVHGHRYFLAITDDWSRYTRVFFLKQKSDAFTAFQMFEKEAERTLERKLKAIQTDHGTEFLNARFSEHCRQFGIRHQKSVVYTPEQNGVIERRVGLIKEAAASMMGQATLPDALWAESIHAAVHVLNRLYSRALGDVPYRRWFGDKPSLDHIRVYGCVAYVMVPRHKQQSLKPKSMKGIFIGYPSDEKGWNIYIPSLGKVIVSRHVTFIEKEFWKDLQITNKKHESQLLAESQAANQQQLTNPGTPTTRSPTAYMPSAGNAVHTGQIGNSIDVPRQLPWGGAARPASEELVESSTTSPKGQDVQDTEIVQAEIPQHEEAVAGCEQYVTDDSPESTRTVQDYPPNMQEMMVHHHDQVRVDTASDHQDNEKAQCSKVDAMPALAADETTSDPQKQCTGQVIVDNDRDKEVSSIPTIQAKSTGNQGSSLELQKTRRKKRVEKTGKQTQQLRRSLRLANKQGAKERDEDDTGRAVQDSDSHEALENETDLVANEETIEPSVGQEQVLSEEPQQTNEGATTRSMARRFWSRVKRLFTTDDGTEEANDRKRKVSDSAELPEPKEHRVNMAAGTHVTLEPPKSYKQAMKRPDRDMWMKAMTTEVKNFQDVQAYELVARPRGHFVLPSRWVFTYKKDENGTILDAKARFVCKGFAQRDGQHFKETFAPTLRPETLRTVLSLAATNDWEVHQLDVKAAYLHAEVDHELYIEPPEGFKGNAEENCVWKMNRLIYGLKQAPRVWYHNVRHVLLKNGFSANLGDACCYVQRRDTEVVIIVHHVDDFLVIGSSLDAVIRTKRLFADHYNIKDLGEAQTFLSIKITRDRAAKEIYLSQSAYVRSVLERFGITECKPCKTPLPQGTIPPFEQDLGPYDCPYLEAVGCLNFLSTWTRPDLSYAASSLSEFMQQHNQLHWELLLRTFRYLLHTGDDSLKLGGRMKTNNAPRLVAYSDAGFAGDFPGRKSRSGCVILLNDGPVAWKSKKQSTTAMATAEAEYVALAYTAHEVKWLRQLLLNLGLKMLEPTLIWEDNQACLKLATDARDLRAVRHLENCYHLTRDYVFHGIIRLAYCKTDLMMADALTKAAGSNVLANLRTVCGLMNRG